MDLSIVIPTCNRPGDLAKCLGSLDAIRQRGISGDVEFVVTDDGRREPAEALIRRDFRWARWIAGPAHGPAANRNHGAREAAGEWIAFIDDDCVADSGWIDAILARAKDQTLDIIEGRTIIPDKRDHPFLHGVENVTGGCYWSCNLAVRRERFLDMGGFDEEFLQAGGEDMEFAWRLKQMELHTVFAPEVLALHPQRPYSVRSFLSRVPLLKWSLLYYQKTGQAPPAGSSAAVIVFAVIKRHFIALLRSSWRNLLGKDEKGLLTRSFFTLWAWLVSPYQLPYLVWWEFRFRNRLAKTRASTPH